MSSEIGPRERMKRCWKIARIVASPDSFNGNVLEAGSRAITPEEKKGAAFFLMENERVVFLDEFS